MKERLEKEQKYQDRMERDRKDQEEQERQREEARAARKEARRKIREEEQRAEEERLARHKRNQPSLANDIPLPHLDRRNRSVDPYPRSWNGYDEEEYYFNELLGNHSQHNREYRNLEDQQQSLYANADVDFVLDPRFETHSAHGYEEPEYFEPYEPHRYGEHRDPHKEHQHEKPRTYYDVDKEKQHPKTQPQKKPAKKAPTTPAEPPVNDDRILNAGSSLSSSISGYNQSSFDSDESSPNSISSSSISSSSSSSDSESSLSSESTIRISSVSTEQTPSYLTRNLVFSHSASEISEDDHIPVFEYPEYDSDFSSESFVSSHWASNGEARVDPNELLSDEQDQFMQWYRHEQAATREREEKALAAAQHAKEQADMAEARAIHAEYKAKLADERAHMLEREAEVAQKRAEELAT